MAKRRPKGKAKRQSDKPAPVKEQTYKVDLLTRVEGEGSFYLRMRGDEVEEARLAIFEAPRFFEAFLRGRSFSEVPDIVARICGICPVAYQMSGVRALENAFGFTPSETLRRLRRLMYCGEWIESHALHVFMLHAPDFLGYASAIEMAVDHREVVERGLGIRRAGNRLIELLGGRAIHPVSPCVGGFTKVPSQAALSALRPELERALEQTLAAVKWASTLRFPAFEQDYVFVALGGEHYPLEWGDTILVSDRPALAVDAWEHAIVETQVPHSNALQSHLKDGTSYLCGPLARLYHHAPRLHPVAAEALQDAGLDLPVRNIYQSIVVRLVEIAHALAEALDLIAHYQPPTPARTAVSCRLATGTGATEAPRGLLWHRYEIDDEGLIADARIVPPTSQNQAQIEQDLRGIATQLSAMEHQAAVKHCEQLIRSYDPCISCATHFLRLDIERSA